MRTSKAPCATNGRVAKGKLRCDIGFKRRAKYDFLTTQVYCVPNGLLLGFLKTGGAWRELKNPSCTPAIGRCENRLLSMIRPSLKVKWSAVHEQLQCVCVIIHEIRH